MKKHTSLWLLTVILSSLVLSGCHTTQHTGKFGLSKYQHNKAGWGRSHGSVYHAKHHENMMTKYEAINKNAPNHKKPSLITEAVASDSKEMVSDYGSTVSSAPSVLFRPGLKDMSYNVNYQKNASKSAVKLDIDVTQAQYKFEPIKKPHIETMVGKKINEMYKELLDLQTVINKHDTEMSKLQISGEQTAGNYYSLLASINSYLQSGTTPGNPELVEMWNSAGKQLEKLAESSDDLGQLANDISNTASKVAFLLDAIQATFSLSGAIEEDHENLTALEDEVSQTVVRLNRMLNTVNDEINRRNSYLRSERLNMQVLSLAIANGELYGKSISSRLFARVADAEDGFSNSGGYTKPPVTAEKRPLVIIKFNKPNIQYQQPLYLALSEALEKYPAAEFDIVSVSPMTNNPAEMALSVADARRNSEDVLRSMTQMGVPTDRIKMGEAQVPNIATNEVHLYIR